MASMKRWTLKRKNIAIGLILVAMLIVTLCGLTIMPSVNAKSSKTLALSILLNHTPTGTADLQWDASKQILTVKIALSGLAPNSTHPDAIHTGSSCNSKTHGAVLFGLNPVLADGTGSGTSTTSISNVQNGLPTMGYIDVHNGPQLSSTLEQERIACVNIGNPSASSNISAVTNGSISNLTPPPTNESPSSITDQNSSSTGNQPLHLTFGSSADDDQSMMAGLAELTIVHNHNHTNLKVKLTLFPLAANSTHMAHIHNGSCTAQGPVVYALNAIHVDKTGVGTSTTTVPDVSSISNGWYINVHQAATMNELGDQTHFDPIACGNISTQNKAPASMLATPTATPFIE